MADEEPHSAAELNPRWVIMMTALVGLTGAAVSYLLNPGRPFYFMMPIMYGVMALILIAIVVRHLKGLRGVRALAGGVMLLYVLLAGALTTMDALGKPAPWRNLIHGAMGLIMVGFVIGAGRRMREDRVLTAGLVILSTGLLSGTLSILDALQRAVPWRAALEPGYLLLLLAGAIVLAMNDEPIPPVDPRTLDRHLFAGRPAAATTEPDPEAAERSGLH